MRKTKMKINNDNLLRRNSVLYMIRLIIATFIEADRQKIILALAHLAIERPVWNAALSHIAKQFYENGEGVEMFNNYKLLRAKAVALANKTTWLRAIKNAHKKKDEPNTN